MSTERPFNVFFMLRVICRDIRHPLRYDFNKTLGISVEFFILLVQEKKQYILTVNNDYFHFSVFHQDFLKNNSNDKEGVTYHISLKTYLKKVSDFRFGKH